MKNFENLTFADDAHKEAFADNLREIGSYAPDTVLTVFLLTATPEARRYFWDTVDCDGMISDDHWDDWTDGDSRRAVALLLNLTHHESRDELAPVRLFDTALYPVLIAALDYWHEAS